MDEKQLETALLIAEAMTNELTDYLMSESLYWQLVVKTPLGTKQPKMTLGALLESLETLHWAEQQLTADQRRRLTELVAQVDLAKGAFAEAWTDKLRRELHANVHSWRWFLEDAARNPAARENYGGEARVRTRLELLAQQLASDPATAADRHELAQLDQQLRAMWQSGGYVGPRGEEALYPPQRAWWLYGTLRRANS